jgi:hypothetical protein
MSGHATMQKRLSGRGSPESVFDGCQDTPRREQFAGRGSVWLERLNGVQEVTGSSPVAPTFLARGQPMDKERRRSRRVNAPFFVRIGYNVSESEKKWEEIVAKNVSENGLAVTTLHSYEIHSFLTLLLRIPTQATLDWLETTGKVVDCTKVMNNAHITRIEFIDSNPEVKNALKKFVHWTLKK